MKWIEREKSKADWWWYELKRKDQSNTLGRNKTVAILEMCLFKLADITRSEHQTQNRNTISGVTQDVIDASGNAYSTNKGQIYAVNIHDYNKTNDKWTYNVVWSFGWMK